MTDVFHSTISVAHPLSPSLDTCPSSWIGAKIGAKARANPQIAAAPIAIAALAEFCGRV